VNVIVCPVFIVVVFACRFIFVIFGGWGGGGGFVVIVIVWVAVVLVVTSFAYRVYVPVVQSVDILSLIVSLPSLSAVASHTHIGPVGLFSWSITRPFGVAPVIVMVMVSPR